MDFNPHSFLLGAVALLCVETVAFAVFMIWAGGRPGGVWSNKAEWEEKRGGS